MSFLLKKCINLNFMVSINKKFYRIMSYLLKKFPLKKKNLNIFLLKKFAQSSLPPTLNLYQLTLTLLFSWLFLSPEGSDPFSYCPLLKNKGRIFTQCEFFIPLDFLHICVWIPFFSCLGLLNTNFYLSFSPKYIYIYIYVALNDF